MSFSERIVQSSGFEKKLFDAMEKMGFAVARNGTEHTYPEFVSALYKSTDQTSLAIRFQPDGVAQIGQVPRSFYVEAKMATTIEKTAWEQYWKLRGNGNVLVVVFGKLGWRWNLLENIRLVPATETTKRFSPGKRFPVVDGWITPRGSQRWTDIQRNRPQASGTPYREVDSESLQEWEFFKSQITKRLDEIQNK